MAGDCNAPVGINTADVIAIQRFFLGLTTGIGNCGSINSILRAARIRALLLTRPARITTRLSSETLPRLLQTREPIPPVPPGSVLSIRYSRYENGQSGGSYALK